MRALAQGLDERESWNRYLHIEGEASDVRRVRRTIDWLRDEFAAAAKRERRPGVARLILLNPQRLPVEAPLPSLEAFALERGLEDFSEAELLEAYAEAFPGDGGTAGQGARPSRRARLVTRQLDALHWLQGLAAQDPRADDPIDAWLNASVASRLARIQVRTLRALVERINGIGARWWARVPGVGAQKAARIEDWLRAHEHVPGLSLGPHVAWPRRRAAADLLARVVCPQTGLVPLEKLVLPSALDGRGGRFRVPAEQCLLDVSDDHAAVGCWIAAKSPTANGRGLSATQRSYRKEAERLLLWCVLERECALSSLDVRDARDFLAFLRTPPAGWCGPRYHQRWSPLWRPTEGALSVAASRQSLVILRSLFAFLIDNGYVGFNPFAALTPECLAIEPEVSPGPVFETGKRVEGAGLFRSPSAE